MAPRKGKETLLELCTQTTLLGNSISVRMLEYLSTVKNPAHGFKELASEFLDTSRILWSVEAGLTEATRRQNQFPSDMEKELDKKFRQTSDDFIVLNQTLLKFLDSERKGGFGKLQKGFRMMFADTNIDHIRQSLARDRESLRMSALVFRWSLGEEGADAQFGIGYTGLMAALDRLGGTTMKPLVPRVSESEMSDHTIQLPLPPPQKNSMVASMEDNSSLFEQTRAEDFPIVPAAYSERQNSQRMASIKSGGSTKSWPLKERESVCNRDTLSPSQVGFKDRFSGDLTDESSKTLIEEQFQELSFKGKDPIHVTRINSDPASLPRRTAKQNIGANASALDSALLTAIHRKQHNMVEQLLNSGARPDGGSDQNLLRAACVNQDVESVRLLLQFGADPNVLDRDMFTPLYSATKAGFLETAKILVSYGADPNLSAGPDSETPLALAVVDNRIDLTQLYLMNGGNAGLIMESGNTALIKAINKTAPKRLLEVMLHYNSDPNAKDGEGNSPLFEAIGANRLDLMTLLLDNGADPNLPGPKHMLWPSVHKPKMLALLLSRGADHKKTPGILELASSIKNLESIAILLKAGVSPNLKKDAIYSPLCSAIRDNSADIVTLLLANGADPNLPASEYPSFKCVTHHRTHLLPQLIEAGANLHAPKGIVETAIAHNNRDALVYLLEQGANVNDKTPDNHTALTTAIREDRTEMLDMLLAAGADPGIRGQDWPICMAVKQPETLAKLLPAIHNPRSIRGVMEMAVVANQLESIKLLLNAGVSVEDKNGGVFSPLTTAIRERRADIVQFLLDEAAADVNAPGEHLPIIKAIRRYDGDTTIIEMLLDRGVDVNKMYRGWNAILQAVENGDMKVLQLLVERGGPVDLTAKDENDRSVLDIVTEQCWDEAVVLLTSNGIGQNCETMSLSSWTASFAGDGALMRRDSCGSFKTTSSCTLPAGRL